MPVGVAIFYGILCLVPVFAVFLAVRLATRRLRREEPPSFTLYRMNRFITYFHTLYLIPFILSSIILGEYVSQTIETKWLHTLCTLVIAVMCFILLKICYTYIAFPIRKHVFGFEMSRVRAALGSVPGSAANAGTYGALYFCLNLLNPAWTQTHQTVISAALAVLFIVFGFITVELSPLFLRAKKMSETEIPASWLTAARDAKLARVQFYLWPTRKMKILNAMATGFFRPKVIVADYVLDSLTPLQVDAVVCHELGHHRKRHLWWNMTVWIAWIPLAQALYQTMHYQHVSLGLSGLLVLLALGAYYGLFAKWLSRCFEYQADAFSAKVTGTQMVSGLEGLSRHSFSPDSISAFDELWRTHPSTEHRIQRLRRGASIQHAAHPSA
jgi:Zn-dependent protease with chaperone function